MISPFIEHQLPNGLRIVMEVMDGMNSAAAGYLVRTGSRDETPELAGVSHFLEHMCFKGTPNRTWEQINIEFDDMGSQYNAFTSKEKTFYFGWVPSELIHAQIELLADLMRSILPEKEFEMEKNVILEEIAMYNDEIEHLSYEYALERSFGGHPLGWPVLGYEKTVRDLTRDQMQRYFSQRYAADNLVLIVAGRIDPDEVIRTAQRVSGDWPASGTTTDRQRPALSEGTSVKAIDRFNQQIVSLLYPAVGGADPMSEISEAVAAILGGNNSRLYWNVMQTGLSSSAGVWRIDFADTGLMFVSAQCEPENCEKLTDALRHEAKRITEDGVQDHEVQRVKNKRRTGLAIEGESPYHRLGQIMQDVDLLGAPRTVDTRLAEVDAITVEGIADYLQQYPLTGAGHLVSVGPRSWPEN
jgi:predicted Zn-dependent peptidase